MAFDNEQRGIVGGVIPAALLSAAVIALAVFTQILATPSGIEQRLRLLALALTVPVICLIRAVGAVANHRFAEPLDRNAAATETRTGKVEMLQAILRNTHEQALIATLVYFIAAILLPATYTDAIPACALLFLIGRIFFTWGYARGAAGRAFGFGLTFYPTAMLGVLTMVAALL